MSEQDIYTETQPRYSAPMSSSTSWQRTEYPHRPREFDPKLADEIVERIGNGELLQDVCGENQIDMPMPGTFLRWVSQEPELKKRYDEARRFNAEIMVDEAVIASRLADPQRAGVRSRAAMWHAERTHPDRYGPRATIKIPETEKDTGGGVDYRQDIRQRIESLREKVAARDAHKEAETSSAQ